MTLLDAAHCLDERNGTTVLWLRNRGGGGGGTVCRRAPSQLPTMAERRRRGPPARPAAAAATRRRKLVALGIGFGILRLHLRPRRAQFDAEASVDGVAYN